MVKANSRQPTHIGVKGAAAILALSEHTVREMANAGKIPHGRDHNNARIFALEDIYALMKQRQKQSSHMRRFAPPGIPAPEGTEDQQPVRRKKR